MISFRPSLAALCATAALLTACGPKTAPPAGFSTCATPASICIPAGGGAAICTDLETDSSNCGTCGNVCTAPNNSGTVSCIDGACAQACPAPETVCGLDPNDGGPGISTCIDTTSDTRHCGSCANSCLDTQKCVASVCVPAGTPQQGTTVCGALSDGGPIYKDLQSDPANCGACGNACAAGEVCENGGCNPCPIAACNNSCVDTNSDPSNCGACGTAVPGGGTCDEGKVVASMQIAAYHPITVGSGNVLPAGEPYLAVSITWGIPIANVRATIKINGATPTGTDSLPAAVTGLDLDSVGGYSPEVWSVQWGDSRWPALLVGQTAEFDFTVYDDQYVFGRADSALHTGTFSFTASVVAPQQLSLTAPTATIVQGGNPIALANNNWVPLNDGPITLTAQLSAQATGATYVSGVMFLSSGSPVGGAHPVIPLSGTSASITLNPAELGTGTRVITAATVDVFGNTQAASPPLTLAIGSIPFGVGVTAQPVLTKGADGAHTIFIEGPNTTSAANGGQNHVLAQTFDQLAIDAAHIGAAVGTDTILTSSFNPTADLSGVLAVKGDGSAVLRFDAGASPAEKSALVVPPAGTLFGGIIPTGITPVALALTDQAASNLWFGQAAPAGGSDASPVEAGGANGGVVTNGFLRQSKSGALFAIIASTVSSTTTYTLVIYHPVITGNHLKSYPLPTNMVPVSFTVFPGGDYTFDMVDTSGALQVGAGWFDGVNQPIAIVPVSVGHGANVGTFTSTGFEEIKPGLMVGATPTQFTHTGGTTFFGYEIMEIDLTQSTPKVYTPLQIDEQGAVKVGPVTNGLSGRTTNVPFTVSDDLTQFAFATSDPVAAPDGNTNSTTLRVLNLAAGTQQAVFTTPYYAPAMRPHFLHGKASYGQLPVAGAPSILVWGEQLVPTQENNDRSAHLTAQVSTLNAMRVYYADASKATIAPVQLDRNALNFDESASSSSLLLLIDEGGGQVGLYQRTLDGGAATQLLLHDVISAALREDTGKLVALGGDGTVYAGSVSAAISLKPIYRINGGAAFSASNAPTAGLTPDGLHAFAFADMNALSSNLFSQATLVTIDLSTGQRTDWGGIVAPLGPGGQPLLAFVDGTKTLYALGRPPGLLGSTWGLFGTTSSAPLQHTFAAPISSSVGNSSATYSLDQEEAFISASGLTLEVGAAVPATLPLDGASITSFGPPARAYNGITHFGPNVLPQFVTLLNGATGATAYKLLVGANRAPIPVAGTPNVASIGTKLTADFNDVFANFSYSDGSAPAVMLLPGPGIASPIVQLQ